jgi:hypothetical protein
VENWQICPAGDAIRGFITRREHSYGLPAGADHWAARGDTLFIEARAWPLRMSMRGFMRLTDAISGKI